MNRAKGLLTEQLHSDDPDTFNVIWAQIGAIHTLGLENLTIM